MYDEGYYRLSPDVDPLARRRLLPGNPGGLERRPGDVRRRLSRAPAVRFNYLLPSPEGCPAAEPGMV
jgi:hypothetical protein